MPRDYDVIIVGAGMVGASLACALASKGIKIAIVESIALDNTEKSTHDDRGIALSPSSKRIFEYLNVWKGIQRNVYPIKTVHVSEQGRFGFVHLDAGEAGFTELGHVVMARFLGQALHRQLEQFDKVTLLCPAELESFQRVDNEMHVSVIKNGHKKTISAGLLVGADGNHSLVRRLAGINLQQHDFGQTAIVSHMVTQKPNHATAYERFTPHGPIALLPFGEYKSILVFTVKTDDACHYLSLPNEQFTKEIEKKFGRRLGQFQQIGKRSSYPIVFSKAMKSHQEQLILLGNAARSIHPNGSQGFNLGLRDVAELTESIFCGIDRGIDISDVVLLENYNKKRAADQQRVMRFSNGLAKTFYNKWPLLNLARNLAMFIIDVVPERKLSFIERSMGIAGKQPRIVRGLSL